jgi:hypothetical protein
MLLPLKKRCVVGALQVLPFPNSDLLVKKVENVFSFVVVSVGESGGVCLPIV